MPNVDWSLVATIAGAAFAVVLLVALFMRGNAKEKGANTVAAASVQSSVDVTPADDASSAVTNIPDAASKGGEAVGASSTPAAVTPTSEDEILVTLTCEPLPGSEGFTREITLKGDDGVYTWTQGSKESGRYEHWKMTLVGESGFTVTGEYIEGTPNLKAVSFTGMVVDGVLRGEGIRGPRKSIILGVHHRTT